MAEIHPDLHQLQAALESISAQIKNPDAASCYTQSKEFETARDILANALEGTYKAIYPDDSKLTYRPGLELTRMYRQFCNELGIRERGDRFKGASIKEIAAHIIELSFAMDGLFSRFLEFNQNAIIRKTLEGVFADASQRATMAIVDLTLKLESIGERGRIQLAEELKLPSQIGDSCWGEKITTDKTSGLSTAALVLAAIKAKKLMPLSKRIEEYLATQTQKE